MAHIPRISALRLHVSAASLAPWAALVTFATVLVWLALVRHTVGDYGVESDFYGGYAGGARAIQNGVWDFRRYVVVGPVYESVLALTGRLVPDLFTAAKLISVAAASGTVCLWFLLLSRLIGTSAALWAGCFLAINPHFLRYGYAASTDMLAVLFQSACMFSLLAARGRWAPFTAGALAGVAVLTRYSSIYLVPAILLIRFLEPDRTERGRRLAASAAGFLVVIGPWLALSLTQGVVPGEGLIRGYAFYADHDGAWNVQDSPPRENGDLVTQIPGLRSVVGADPMAFLTSRLREIPRHLEGDARHLLGWPATVALLLGVWGWWSDPRRRGLIPIIGIAVLCFLTLLAAFHSPRYSLPMVLFYTTTAAGILRFDAVPGVRSIAGRLAVAGAFAVVALTLVTAVQAQRSLARETPREVIAAGQALASVGDPDSPVIARKGHIGYYSGHRVVPFPRVRTLRELGDYARRNDARYLYFSWFETQMRPELAYLLDPTAEVPGLSIVHSSDSKPAILFRIGPELGRAPEWIANDFQKSVHTARAIVRVQGESAPASHRAVLAIDALLRQEWSEALDFARGLTEEDPQHALAWAVQGEALRRLTRYDEARTAFHRAIELDPSDPAAKIGLGRIELVSGNPTRAMNLWRAAARAAEDVRTLDEISRLLGNLSDSLGVREIRRDMRRIEREASNDQVRPSAGPPSANPRHGAMAARLRRTGSL